MKIEVKLYSYHDMDLVSLYKTGQVSFPETTRQILNSYANKEAYKVRLLETNTKRLSRYPSDSYRKYYHYHVVLDEKDDGDAVRLLKHITPGYRNNFIKAILRQYLCGAFIADYSIDGDTKFFDEMSRRFQGDREERDVKLEKRKKKKAKKENLLKKNEEDCEEKNSKKKITDKRASKENVSKQKALQTDDKYSIKETGNNKSAEHVNEAKIDFTAGQNSYAGINKKNNHKVSSDNKKQNVVIQTEVEEKKKINPQISQTEERLKLEIPKIKESQDNTESDYDEDFDDDFDDFLGGTTEQY